jgi:hypothetical protein
MQAFAWGIASGSAALLQVGHPLSGGDDIRRLQPQVVIRRL